MARFFRLWGKKRGERRSGPRRLGEIGEALFFTALVLLGCVLLIKLMLEQASREGPADAMFGLTFGVMALLLILGSVGLVFTLAQMRISTERRCRQASFFHTLSRTRRPHSWPRSCIRSFFS